MFPPSGLGTTNTPTATSAYSAAPQRSGRYRAGRNHAAAAANPAVRTKSPKRNGNRPPSGKDTANSSTGIPAASATRTPARRAGGDDNAYAVAATTTNTAATGLESGAAIAKATAARFRP